MNAKSANPRKWAAYGFIAGLVIYVGGAIFEPTGPSVPEQYQVWLGLYEIGGLIGAGISGAFLGGLYQRRQLLTCVCPLSQSDGHDGFGLIDEPVPGLATGLDDGVVVFEDAV